MKMNTLIDEDTTTVYLQAAPHKDLRKAYKNLVLYHIEIDKPWKSSPDQGSFLIKPNEENHAHEHVRDYYENILYDFVREKPGPEVHHHGR